MGREEGVKGEVTRLGKYNVKVVLSFRDGTSETIDVNSWYHIGGVLGLDITNIHLRIIPLNSLKYFDVIPQEMS